MPSPFPGMDPWLEGEETFPNLHERLIISMQDALNEALPPGYVATSKNRVWVDDELRREPDVALFGPDAPPDNGNGHTAPALAGLAMVAERLAEEPLEEPYLEILSAKGKRLVTAVEVISLTNKRAGEQGRKTYSDKQEEYWLSGVNLVEVDLLRRGPHVSATPHRRVLARFGPFDYHVSVVLARQRPAYHAAGFKLADRLPAFAVPLEPGVQPVLIDLQPMLDRAYDRGRYAELVNYRAPADPALAPEQQAWAEGVLRAKGLLS